ncbi:hypothetical protein BFJ63_vAg7717 [Fusarium oxysporum f. sp. narcissi]|uniref:Uncharacterized protein n=3 Tax=Fusarium oxysporum TaxID=5507 RepID=A0A420PWQ5_FUSOX|nr:hypothetical protein BFJ65_g16703 [Fusarium oxysporum f. sp. cepae]RKK96955.1 hypothetical protein BFJ71_g7525 [Fusarium oxysporum]RYC89464.1 hypothetical protein BFJ63_vAg7717 [Fusarium oxysporum f. sp. narcissi]RKK39337.1 hypothetical protein BFJ67_g11516 [Fusarium oxysporum f. sp. cepae]RKK41218.1 hypothetical protein BFJ66_g11108 [Fusarium oxysporum f. sp. cepae]
MDRFPQFSAPISIPGSPSGDKQEHYPDALSQDPQVHECGKGIRCHCQGCDGCTGKIYCITSLQCYDCYCNCPV